MLPFKNSVSLQNLKRWAWFRFICLSVLLIYSVELFWAPGAQAQSIVMAPVPGTLLSASSAMSLPSLKAISVDPQDPLKINFLIDAANRSSLDEEASRPLIKYFLTFLTMPEEDLWVNLSPAEPDRIINSALGATSVGRDMLLEDYLLKQLAASMTFPEREPGKAFWEQVYAKIKYQYGDVELPLNTFSKVWIVPERSVVYEQKNAAVVAESHLKVMLDEDYLTMKKTVTDQNDEVSELYLKIAREIIIPTLEQEVNEGQYFAPLRQMFNSLVLAIWFKRRLQDHVLNEIYTDQKKTEGIQIEEEQVAQKVYEQYMLALKKGVYNIIREEVDPVQQEIIPRRYFSGGLVFSDTASHVEFRPMPTSDAAQASLLSQLGSKLFLFFISLIPQGMSTEGLLSLILVAGAINGSEAIASGKASTVSPMVAQASPGIVASNVVAAVPPVAMLGSQGQQFPVEADAVAEQIADFTVHAKGVIRGLAAEKVSYKKGEAMFRLEDPDTIAEVSRLSGQMRVAQKRLDDAKTMALQGAATANEVAEAETAVRVLAQQLAAAQQHSRSLTIYAPCDLTVQNWKDFVNDADVTPGESTLVYETNERLLITVKMPLTQAYFGRMNDVRINDEPIEGVPSVKWDTDHEEQQAVLTLLVRPGSKIEPGRVRLSFELLPFDTSKNGPLDNIRGEGRPTISAVESITELSIPAPALGPVRRLVIEGDEVEKGQPLGILDGTVYQEYKEVSAALNLVRDQIQRWRQDASRDKIDDLRNQEAALKAKLDALIGKAERLVIRAPERGWVTRWAGMEGSVFAQGNNVVWMKTAPTIVGDKFDMQRAILLPADLQISEGDPVLLETPFGGLVPGRLMSPNPNVLTSEMDLGNNVMASSAVFQDEQGLLWNGLPVRVIVPTADERSVIEEELQAIAARQQAKVQQSFVVQPVAERTDSVEYKVKKGDSLRRIAINVLKDENKWEDIARYNRISAPYTLNIGDVLLIPQMSAAPALAQALVGSRPLLGSVAPFLVSGQPLTLGEVASQVAGNDLLHHAELTEVQLLQLAEKLPHSVRLGIEGGIRLDKTGKPTWNAGVSGMVEGFLGKLETGDAIGAASPIVFSLLGQVMDLISGKNEKARQLAVKRTEIEIYRMKAAVADQVYQAQLLLIDIGLAQRQVHHLQGLLASLKEADRVIQIRQAHGEATEMQAGALQGRIRKIEDEIADWNGKKDLGIIDLNFLCRGSGQVIAPKLPWEGTFSPVSQAEEAAWQRHLVSSNSPNYIMRAAALSVEEMARAVALQRAGEIDWVDMTALYSTKAPDANHSLVPSEAISTSQIGKGLGGQLGINIPVIDTKRKIDRQHLAAQVQSIQDDYRLTALQQQAEAAKVAAQTRSSSEQIKAEEREVSAAWNSLQGVIARGNLRAEELEPALDRFYRAQMRQDLSRADFFRAEAALPQMQLMGYQETRVKEGRTGLPFGQQATAAVGRAIVTGAKPNPQVSQELVSLLEAPAVSHSPRGGEISAAWVRFPDNIPFAELYALMAGESNSSDGRLQSTIQTLKEDPNAKNRAEALQDFMSELQSDPRANTAAAEDIVLTSSSADVVNRILLFMLEQEGTSPEFFTRIIDQALAKNNVMAVQLALQALSDLYVQETSAAEGFSELNAQDPQTSTRVLLSSVSTNVINPLAAIHILRGNYLTRDQLLEIAKALEAKGGSEDLRALVYGEALRRSAADPHNMEQAFYKNGFVDGIVSPWDKDTAFMLDGGLTEINETFLRSSPHWLDLQKYISPDLFKRVKKSVNQALGSRALAKRDGGRLLLDVALPTPNDDLSLSYVQSLGEKEARAYVQRTKNSSELARIFVQIPWLRGDALKRLMTPATGSSLPADWVLVLQAYNASSDDTDDGKALQDLVEAQDWQHLLVGKLQGIQDPVSMSVVREALEKMSRNIKDWSLDTLKTLNFSELHAASDPRGMSAVRKQMWNMAIGLAVAQQRQDIAKFRRHSGGDIKKLRFLGSAGASSSGGRETDILDEVERLLAADSDPQLIRDYLGRLKQDGTRSEMKTAKKLLSWGDHFYKKIIKNDQSFLSFPWFSSFVASLVLLTIVWKLIRVIQMKMFMKNASVNQLYDILMDGPEEAFKRRKSTGSWDSDSAMSVDNIDFKRIAKLKIPKKDLYNSTGDLLERWQGRLSAWVDGARSLTPQEVVIGLNEDLNDASRILRKIPFTASLIGRENAELNIAFAATLNYFTRIAASTLMYIDRYVVRDGIDPKDKELIRLYAEDLLEMLDYAKVYQETLSGRHLIDQVMGYKYADGHSRERWYKYPFFRKLIGEEHKFKEALKKQHELWKHILEKGNDIIPGLYGDTRDRSILLLDCKTKLEKVITNAEVLFSLPETGSESKNGRYDRRQFFIGLTILTVIFPAILSFFGWQVAGGLSLVAALGFAFRFYLYWAPVLKELKMARYLPLGHMIEGLRKNFQVNFGTASSRKDPEVQLATAMVSEGGEVLEDELDRHQDIDMVVLCAQDPLQVDGLKNYVRGRYGRVFRSGVPVGVFGSKRGGSANAYFESLAFVQDHLKDEEFLKRYPNLKGRSSQDVRALFVFVGAGDASDERILDWSVIKGYRAAKANTQIGSTPDSRTQRKSEHHLVVYSQDFSLEPALHVREEDVNIWGHWGDRDEIRSHGLLNLNADGRGVKEIQEKLDIQDLENPRDASRRSYTRTILDDLKSHYNLDRNELQEFPVQAGIVRFGPKAIAVLGKVLDKLREDPLLWERLKYMHMSVDVLNNLLVPEVDVATHYLDYRSYFLDILQEYKMTPVEARNLFKSYYEFFSDARRDVGGDLSSDAIVPYVGSMRSIHIKDRSTLEEAQRLLRLGGLEGIISRRRASTIQDEPVVEKAVRERPGTRSTSTRPAPATAPVPARQPSPQPAASVMPLASAGQERIFSQAELDDVIAVALTIPAAQIPQVFAPGAWSSWDVRQKEEFLRAGNYVIAITSMDTFGALDPKQQSAALVQAIDRLKKGRTNVTPAPAPVRQPNPPLVASVPQPAPAGPQRTFSQKDLDSVIAAVRIIPQLIKTGDLESLTKAHPDKKEGLEFFAGLTPKQRSAVLLKVKDYLNLQNGVLRIKVAASDKAEATDAAELSQQEEAIVDLDAAMQALGAVDPQADDFGGLDLSGTRDSIVFQAGQDPADNIFDPAYRAGSQESLQLLRGFDFRMGAFLPLDNLRTFLSF